MLGAKRFTRLMIERPFTGTVLLNRSLVRSEVRRRKWLLPPLVRTSVPEPVKRNLLEVALWVFSLYFFPGFALRGIAGFSFQTKLTADISSPRTFNIVRGITVPFRALRTFRLPLRS